VDATKVWLGDLPDKRAFGRPDDPFTYKIRLKRAPWLPTELQLELLDGCDSGNWVPKATQVVQPGQVEVAWDDISMSEYWGDEDAGETCKFRIYIEKNGQYLGPFNGPQIISSDFPLEFLSALLQGGWGEKTVYTEIDGRNILLYHMGALTPDQLRALLTRDVVEEADITFSTAMEWDWDLEALAALIEEVWVEVVEEFLEELCLRPYGTELSPDDITPELLQEIWTALQQVDPNSDTMADLRREIIGVVHDYYNLDPVFKEFVDALAEDSKALEVVKDIILGLAGLAIPGIDLVVSIVETILAEPELPDGLAVMEAFLWVMMNNPQGAEFIMSLLEMTGEQDFQVNLVLAAVRLYGSAELPDFQTVGLRPNLVTAFFESLYKAMGTQSEFDMWLLLGNLANSPELFDDKEGYADGVALGVAMGNAASGGWEVFYHFDPLIGHYAHMIGELGGEKYHVFVHAEASLEPEDLVEIPDFISRIVGQIHNVKREWQAGTGELIDKAAIVIPVFEATQSEIDQLETRISEMYGLPSDTPIILIWIDEYTGIVHGKCINCPAGKEDQILNDAALAQFGVGIGEQWPHWVDPEGFLPEVAAFFDTTEEAGYQILGTPICLQGER
jgi:hypothetical protein